MNHGPISRDWSDLDSQRRGILETVAICAALSSPWVFPPLGQLPDQPLPENSQSMGSRGVQNHTGKLLLSVAPPDRPWVQQRVAPEIWDDPEVPAELKQRVQQKLYMQDMILMALLEQPPKAGDRRLYGYYANRRRSLEQLVVTGDTLEFMDAEYQMNVIRRDNYVTERDRSGRILRHIIREKLDPLTELTPKQLAAAQFEPGSLDNKSSRDRQCELFTQVKWHPRRKGWMITQEVNGHEIHNSFEKVSPYFCTSYCLAPGENYGRGLVELNLGDLKCLDAQCARINDAAAMASKYTPILDENSMMQERDLADKSGVVKRGKVREGKAVEIAMLKVDKAQDFQFVIDRIAALRADLGAAFLIESESVRDSERTTAFEVSQVTLKEATGNLGSVLAMINDQQQLPLFNRLYAQAVANKHITPINEELKGKAVRVQVLTGLSALAQQVRAQGLMRFVQVAAQIEQIKSQYLDIETVLQVYARYERIDEPGVIKSKEQRAADQADALKVQAQLEMQKAAAQTVGAVAQQSLAGTT